MGTLANVLYDGMEKFALNGNCLVGKQVTQRPIFLHARCINQEYALHKDMSWSRCRSVFLSVFQIKAQSLHHKTLKPKQLSDQRYRKKIESIWMLPTSVYKSLRSHHELHHEHFISPLKNCSHHLYSHHQPQRNPESDCSTWPTLIGAPCFA